jgi:hypothetical protein
LRLESHVQSMGFELQKLVPGPNFCNRARSLTSFEAKFIIPHYDWKGKSGQRCILCHPDKSQILIPLTNNNVLL